ncbi:MAG: glycosyltransferase [Oscillospiraceae bacterium]|nr:glycosyltransferase [Oscillospiraceae bacterium]
MNDKPLISVIVPMYNCEKYIAKCIESLSAQTYDNLEIIIVDDGSEDRSGEICRELASEDKRIKFIRQDNGGISSARNKGFNCASGEWVSFCDSDDHFEPDMLDYLLSAAMKHNADIVQCGVIMEYGNGKSVTAYSPEQTMVADGLHSAETDFLKNLGKYVHSKLFRRELLEGMSFNIKYSVGEDFLFSVEAALAAKKIVLESKPKYHYVQHSGSACYSAPTAKSLSDWRSVPLEIMNMIQDDESLRRYYLNELLKTDFDIAQDM